MSNHERYEHGVGPIYSVPLIGGLPLNPEKPGGMKQQLPSRADLDAVHPQHDRVVGGYEVLLHHWRWQQQEIERLRLYERAMQSMAAQFVHPKMTAEELAKMQLGEE